MGFKNWIIKQLGISEEVQMSIAKKKQTAIPTEYERWDDPDPSGMRPDWINPTNELRDFLSLYQVHPWVYSCITAIATTSAGVPWRILKNEKEDKKAEIGDILRRPNPHQVWQQFIEQIQIYMESCGNAFIEEVRDNKGKLYAMYVLRPDKIKILPHPKVKVAGYIFEPSPGREILFSEKEITHLYYQSSIDDYWGISAAYAAQNSLILDINATTYNKKFFTNSAIPEGVLETEGSISDQTYKRLKLDWAKRHRGVMNAFELAILEEGLKYRPIGITQKDMMMVEMKKLAREDVLSTYRVPPVIVGLLEYAGVSSSREQRKMFYMDNIIPKLEKLALIFNENIMPEGYKLQFIVDAINSVIEDVQISTQVAMSLVSHGIFTIDEVRRKFFAMDGVPWGKVPWMPVGLAQYDPNAPKPVEGGEEAAFQSPAQALNRSTPMGESKPDPDKAMRPGLKDREKKPTKKAIDFEKLNKATPDWDDPKQVKDYEAWNFWKGLANYDYHLFYGFFKSYFAKQYDELLPKLRSVYKPKKKKVKGLSMISKIMSEEYTDAYRLQKYDEEELEGDIVNLLIGVEKDGKRMKAKFYPSAKATVKKHGIATLGQIGLKGTFDIDNERVADFLKKSAGKQIEEISKSTRKILAREISKGYRNGEDFDDMMMRVHRAFKGDISELRARRIARTETITLTQFAKLEAATQGGATKKRWVSLLLDSTRDKADGENHVHMNGEEVGINEKFMVKSRTGYDEMDGPGDPSASPENIVFCVCTLDFPSDIKEFEDLEGLNEKEIRELLSEDEKEEKKKADEGVGKKIENEKPNQQDGNAEEDGDGMINLKFRMPKSPDIIINQAPITVNPTPVNVEVFNTVKPTPVDIVVNNKIQPSEVNVEVTPTPIQNIVNTQEVKLNPEIKMPKRKKKTVVTRNEKGEITSTEETEETDESKPGDSV